MVAEVIQAANSPGAKTPFSLDETQVKSTVQDPPGYPPSETREYHEKCYADISLLEGV